MPPARPDSAEDVALRVLRMAALQERHNVEIHHDWRHQGYAYYRAVWVECAELLDHYGWKWWKRQEADLDQVRLEIVDIWHFGLSELLRDGRIDLPNRKVSTEVMSAMMRAGTPKASDFRLAVERLAETSLKNQSFDPGAFAIVMASLPMNLAELHRLYIGKNLLNSFRQAHGYKDGSYVKLWQGREDNEHLVEILADLDPLDESFEARLRVALEARYREAAQLGSAP